LNLLKKNKSNIIFGVILLLVLIPQTRVPIQVFLQRLIAFSPSEIKEEKREKLTDYNWNLHPLNTDYDFEVAQGEVLFINFWATWCPPCIAEMPAIQNLYNDYGKKVKFYLVSNENSEVIQKFLNKNDYNFPIHQSLSSPPSQLESRSLPTTYIIDKSGKIVVKKVGVADWNSSKTRALLDKLLNE
jgi:thiol-disulfide isomerase/thioredoxin